MISITYIIGHTHILLSVYTYTGMMTQPNIIVFQIVL